MMKKNALDNLIKNLEQCGYTPHLVSITPLYMGLGLDGEVVGHIGDNGPRIYDDYLGEKDRIENLMQYNETFLERPENSHGHREIATISGHTLAAGLDPKDGTPSYYIYPEDAESDRVQQSECIKDFSTAKKYFAVDAGLSVSPHGTDYRHQLLSNARQLFEQNGYECSENTSTGGYDISRKGTVIGVLGEDMKLAQRNSDKAYANLSSVYQQARWETDNDMYGNSVFTKQLSDFLVRLGYSIRHTLQGMTLFLHVNKGDSQIAGVRDNGAIQPGGTLSPVDASAIRNAVEAAKEEMRLEFQQMQMQFMRDKSEQGQEQATEQPETPIDSPAEDEDRGTGATSCDITRVEAALVVALLGTQDGKKLAEKHNVRHVAFELDRKMRETHPEIPESPERGNGNSPTVQPSMEGEELEL